MIFRNASVLAFHMWPTIFAGAPFRLQNIYRNGVPPRSRTNTPLGPPCSGIWQLHDAFIGHASPSCLAAANTFSSVQFVCSCERAFKPTCRKLIVLAVFCRYLSNRSNVSAIHRQTALGGCNMQGRPKSGATNSWPLFCHILTDFHNFFHWKIS